MYNTYSEQLVSYNALYKLMMMEIDVPDWHAMQTCFSRDREKVMQSAAHGTRGSGGKTVTSGTGGRLRPSNIVSRSSSVS